MTTSKNYGYFLIALAGFFWSTISIFTSSLIEQGFSSPQISFMRLLLGAIFLIIYCLIKDRSALKITKKGILICIVLGIFCQALFNLSYITSIDRNGASVAAVLLYTSPIFLTILSKLVYKEQITKAKIISLAFCVVGAYFSATGGILTNTLTAKGIGFGLTSAILYAILPLISKPAFAENKNITIIIYSFLFGAITLLPFTHPLELLSNIHGANIILHLIGLGIFPSVLSFLCFYAGIAKNVEFSIAGIMSSTELIGAQLIGWFLLGEPFTIVKLFGIAVMILSAYTALFSKNGTEQIDA